MTYRWAKNAIREAQAPARAYLYKGLTFPLFEGYVLEEGGRSSQPRYAFYGKRALTQAQIREHVDMMIRRGEYQRPTYEQC